MKIKSINKIGIFFLFICMFVFSGCVNIEINQDIQEDGNSKVSIMYDFTSMVDSMDSFGKNLNKNTTTNESEKSFCDDFPEKMKKQNFTCTEVEKYKYLFEGNWKVSDKNFKVERSLTETKYTYNPQDVFNMFDAISEEGSNYNFDKEKLAGFKMMNIVFDYKVTLPEKPTSTTIGSIQDNTVTIDMINLAETTNPQIIIIKKNYTPLYIGGGILIIALILIISMIIGKKNKNIGNIPKPIEEKLTKDEIRCKNYIIKYKNSYSKEAIKKALKATKTGDKKINDYINKYY